MKAVAQAIPVFAMSVFCLPKGICKEITDVIAQFWWGDDEEHKKMHWYSWWKLCYPKSEGGMGFRDLYSFNLAMLAKQCWRLITNPDSLCAKVLKAKYYPNVSLIQASLKNGASFTWQSIMKGLELFKRGYIWRIGSGEEINIWSDPWVPSSPDRKVITPRGQALLTRVNELIDPNSGTWDEALIRMIFSPVDARRILQIPLNHHAFEDFIAWHPDRRGLFSVRSAYHVQWMHTFGARANNVSRPGGSAIPAVWSALWKLTIPRKTLIFCWRLLHGILPLKGILANRHIGAVGACPICHQNSEDIRHLFFQCIHAQGLWRRLGLSEFISSATEVDRSGSVIMEHILLLPDSPLPIMPSLEIKHIVVVGCWFLWWTRRQITHNEPFPPIDRWHMSVLAITNNYHKAFMKNSAIVQQRWSRPEPKFTKLNVDAAYFPDVGGGATAAVLRDEKGTFLAAQCNYIPYAADVVSTEAIAMRDGLSLASNLGFQRVVAESDSQEVINFCTGQTRWWDAAAAIFAECVDIGSTMGEVKFKHCYRSANQAAHVLANYSFCNHLSSVWTDEPPDCLVSKLIDDVSLMCD